jgi:DNA-binding protein H-NS
MEKSRTKELTEQVIELNKKQIEEMRKLEEQREQALKAEKYDESAEEVYNLYQSYIKSGFTAEQAWELVKITITNVTKRSLF